MTALSKFFGYIDVENNKTAFIDRLRGAIAIKSVSGEPTLRDEVIKMGEKWLYGQLKDLGANPELVWLDTEPVGSPKRLPPLVTGRIGSDTAKKTVLVYGHYDVMPADKADGWTQEDPFKLDVQEKIMVGRGSTDDKGPCVAWLNVLQAHKEIPLDLPVNIRFCFEGMEESGSTGLDDFVKEEVKKGKGGLFDGVSYVCITDNYWLNNRKPALTYGLRGVAYFGIHIKGAKADLHSGIFGRMVHEPMTDMVKLLSKLVETNGIITVPGVELDPLSPEERKEYEALDYNVQDLREAVGANIELSECHTQLVINRMRLPSLSIHTIKGTFTGDSPKTIIPHEIVGEFSIRLVEPQTAEFITTLVTKFLNDEFKKLESKNTMWVTCDSGVEPWVARDKHDSNFQAAERATRTVYGQIPDYTREGGSIGSALIFQDNLGENTSVMLLPMGRSDDHAHSTNEKLDKENFFGGTKLFGAYLYELAAPQA